MSTQFTRRGLLRAVAGSSLAAGLGTGLAACGSGSETRTGRPVLEWWENSKTKAALNKKIFARHADELGGTVKITHFANTKMGQSLQLAKQSNQLPDVHTITGLRTDPSILVDAGWFQPLDLPQEARAAIEDYVIDGVHRFNGKLYTFPGFSPRSYGSMLWFNHDLVAKAGLDPAAPPKTYDDFRAACRTVKKKSGGKTTGLVLPLKDPKRISDHVGTWACAAGFAGHGPSGQLFKTGEYAYDSEPFLAVIEFLMSIKKDGLLLSSSSQLDGATTRGRWASGSAAYEFDGPWVPGNIKLEFPSLADKVAYAPMLVPGSSHQPVCYSGPAPGIYYISKTSKKADLANAALGLVAGQEWQIGFASMMDQPPRDPATVDKSQASEVYKSMVKMLAKSCYLRPLAVRRQPDIAKVNAEYKRVNPGLGEVVQRYLMGDGPDIRSALRKLDDASEKALDTAIAQAKTKRGSRATRDDYAFANWQPNQDYTKEMYK